METEGLDIHFPNRNSRKVSRIENSNDTDVKTFRQSLWNTNLVKKNFTLTVIIGTLFAPVVLIATNSVWICLAFVLSGYALFPIYFRWSFYVILSTEKLIIQNGVYSSSRKEYLFHEIAKVKITRGKDIYMQVFTKAQEQVPRRYCIDVVALKDYKLLVDMIKAKGISVETEGLERYLV